MGKRSSTYKYSSYADLTNTKDPVVMECIQLLSMSPCSKKEIANRLNLDFSVVHKIYQYNIVDKKIISAKNAVKEQEKKLEEINNSKIEEKEEEKRDSNMGKQHLTDDMIIALCSDIESGMSYDDAVKKYGCSKATIYRHCKSMGVECNKKKKKKEKIEEPVVETAVVEEISETTDTKAEETINTAIPVEVEEVKEIVVKPEKEPEFVKVSNSAFIRAALIDKRHEMPVSKYIFEDVRNERLFDYEWYNNVVKNWLITNIPKTNGIWQKTLDCYVTGLPAASISVSKVCQEMGVNLIFSHYNADTAKYEKQVVWDKFPVLTSSENDPTVLGRYFEGMDVYILNNTSILELSKTNSWYCISIRKMIGDSKADIIKNYLLKDFNDIFKYFGNMVVEINAYREPYIAQANEIIVGERGEYIFGDQICKSYNKATLDRFKEKKMNNKI